MSVTPRTTTIRAVSAALGLLLFAGAAGAATPAARKAFDFTYVDINPRSDTHGQQVTLSRLYAGEGLVLNFLASWCPPCWREVPSFAKLDEQVTTPVVFVAADEYDGPADLLKRLEMLGVRQPVLLVPPKDIVEMEQHYDHDMLPSTYMIDGQGTIRQVLEGMLSEQTLFRAQQRHFPKSGADLPSDARPRGGASAH